MAGNGPTGETLFKRIRSRVAKANQGYRLNSVYHWLWVVFQAESLGRFRSALSQQRQCGVAYATPFNEAPPAMSSVMTAPQPPSRAVATNSASKNWNRPASASANAVLKADTVGPGVSGNTVIHAKTAAPGRSHGEPSER